MEVNHTERNLRNFFGGCGCSSLARKKKHSDNIQTFGSLWNSVAVAGGVPVRYLAYVLENMALCQSNVLGYYMKSTCINVNKYNQESVEEYIEVSSNLHNK